MSRFTDAVYRPRTTELPPLPVVDWPRVDQQAPTPIPIDYKGEDAPLPTADIVVVTWTSAEWSAFDHVFLNSDTTRGRYDRAWEKHWYLYSRGVPTDNTDELWGFYQLVQIGERRVLLFKSSTHLAHPPWLAGLNDMLEHIFEDAKPKRIYSIGTAGGSTLSERLGDTVVTNSGHLRMKTRENRDADINNQTFTSVGFFPPTKLFDEVQKQLLMPLSIPCTYQELTNLLNKLHSEKPESQPFGLEDLVNEALAPENLTDPKGLSKPGSPLLTTDYFFIATGDDAEKYSALEMDDAVIAHAAGERQIEYAFFRNISDPVVPAKSQSGETIPSEVRDEWSSLIYETFGLYTSFNGALLTWASLVEDD